MKLWKVLGLAGLAGVAATGVIIAREQRKRAQLTPEEIRARLLERLEEAAAATNDGVVATGDTGSSRGRWWHRLRRSGRGADQVAG